MGVAANSPHLLKTMDREPPFWKLYKSPLLLICPYVNHVTLLRIYGTEHKQVSWAHWVNAPFQRISQKNLWKNSLHLPKEVGKKLKGVWGWLTPPPPWQFAISQSKNNSAMYCCMATYLPQDHLINYCCYKKKQKDHRQNFPRASQASIWHPHLKYIEFISLDGEG